MATDKERRSLISRCTTIICSPPFCKSSKDDEKDDDIIVTRVYQSRSLTEQNSRKTKLVLPKVTFSEITAADLEKSFKKEKKRKRRFWHFGKWKWNGRNDVEVEMAGKKEEYAEDDISYTEDNSTDSSRSTDRE